MLKNEELGRLNGILSSYVKVNFKKLSITRISPILTTHVPLFFFTLGTLVLYDFGYFERYHKESHSESVVRIQKTNMCFQFLTFEHSQ